MAIIYSYSLNTDLLASDMLVGTATKLYAGKPKNETKNFSLGELAYFISTSGYNTLDAVLNNGNTSLLGANVGEVGIWDPTALSYAKVKVLTSAFQFYSANYPLSPMVSFDFDSIVFNNMNFTSTIFTGTPTANRLYTLPNASGTIALTSDIPVITTPTLDEVLLSGNTVYSNTPIIYPDDGLFYTSYENGAAAFTNTSSGDSAIVGWSGIRYQTSVPIEFTEVGFINPSGINVIQFPDASGTIALTSDIPAAITLTTTGTSGAATLVGTVLNIPVYAGGSTYTFTSPLVDTAGVITINQSNTTTNGYLSSTDWNTFNGKQDTITLTTTGSGAATFISNVLNIPTPPTATFTSLTTTGSSGSSTLISGVLNVPTYTLAGLGGQAALSGTGIVKSTAGTISYINGTTAEYVRGDGSLATFPTITGGTVTSVGLSMPSAFTVSNSPITSSGTIAVTGAGTVSQYVRGDGTLANFPNSTGGGASVNYYLNGSVSQGTFGGTTYYQMSKTPILGAGTNFTRTNGAGNGYIASFITDAGDPSFLNIPGGNWNLEFYFQSSASGGSPQFYGEIYKVSATNVFTLVASGSANPESITNGTTVDQYFTSIPMPQTSLLITDRLAIRIYVITGGRTITLHTENGNLCEVLTTFTTGLTALNGLTSQVQYFAVGTSGTDFNISSATDTHTFNLPTASATNRGALSTTDWSAFNGKFNLPTLTAGSVLFSNGTTIAQDNANFFWDDTNNRLGIGTSSPTTLLDVRGGFNVSDGTSTVRIVNSGGVGLIGTLTTHPLAIRTDNTERMRITEIGNVGIGTSTPSIKLQVETSVNGSDGIWARNANTGTSAYGFVVAASGVGTVGVRAHSAAHGAWPNTSMLHSATGFTGGLSIYQDGANPIAFWTNATERMRITSAGNVGIGTTTPYSRFTTLGALSTSTSQMSIVNSEGGHIILRAGIASISNAGFSLISADVAGTNQNTRLVVSSSGNVGIGTTNPLYKLDVNGTGRFSNDLLTNNRFAAGSGTNINCRVFASAFSGELASAIFTTFDSAQSTQEAVRFSTADFVSGAVRIFPRVSSASYNTITVADSAVIANATTKPLLIGVQDGSAIQFTTTDTIIGTNNSEKMRITSGGNVGIGTASPSAKLNVSGDIHIGDYGSAASRVLDFRTSNSVFAITTDGTTAALGTTFTYSFSSGGGGPLKFNNAGGEVMRLDSTGNVGIGTTSPTTKLDVNGVITATGGNSTSWNAKQNALVYTPYRYINTTQPTVTGTTAETIVATATINANTFNSADVMKILFSVNKTVIGGTTNLRVKINTTNTITGSTQIAVYGISAANSSVLLQRTFSLNGGNLYGFPFATNAVTDAIVSAVAYNSTAYNTSNTLYIFFTLTNSSAADSASLQVANIIN